MGHLANVAYDVRETSSSSSNSLSSRMRHRLASVPIPSSSGTTQSGTCAVSRWPRPNKSSLSLSYSRWPSFGVKGHHH